MPWTLADIRQKVRKITGRFSVDEMSDDEINEYINNYYVYSFPAEVKLNTNLTYVDINTVAYQEYYDLPLNITNIEPPVWINGFPSLYFLTPQNYFRAFPEYYIRKVLGVGDGTTFSYSQASINQRIISGSVIVTDNVETFTDNGLGILIGSLGGTGTVDYSNGTISVTFISAPLSGVNVMISYQQYRAAVPQTILFFENKLRLFPIPDGVYQIKMVGYKQPDILSLSSSSPEVMQWGPVIAYGAARNIFADNGELDRYAEISILYKEELKLALRKTLQDFSNTRAIPQN